MRCVVGPPSPLRFHAGPMASVVLVEMISNGDKVACARTRAAACRPPAQATRGGGQGRNERSTAPLDTVAVDIKI